MTVALFIALLTALGYVNIPCPSARSPYRSNLRRDVGRYAAGKSPGLYYSIVVRSYRCNLPGVCRSHRRFRQTAGPHRRLYSKLALAAAVIGLITGAAYIPAGSVFSWLISPAALSFIPWCNRLSLVTGIGLIPAAIQGALPFIPGDLIKCGVAAAAGLRLRQAYPSIIARSSQSQARN